MTNAVVLIDERAKGVPFPVSIATSLAIEGIFGILEDKPHNPPPADQLDEIVINFRTLFRNMTGSMDRETADKLNADDYATGLIEEMTLIRSIVNDRSGGRIKVWYYVASYASLNKLHPYALVKPANTPKQQYYAAMENKTIEVVMKRLGKDNDMLKIFDVTIVGNPVRTALISNYPLDLLNFQRARELVLVESHTGTVKPKAQWYTKLKGGKDMPYMPFNIMTIQMFGDTGSLFQPQTTSNQNRLRELAQRYKWTQATGKDRIMQCVALEHDPIFEGNIRKLYS